MVRPVFSPSRSQRGSTLIEFSLAAVLLLTLGLGVVETAHWFGVRQILSLALVEAARAGALTHAQPQEIEQAFERGLLPLFGSGAVAVASRQTRLAQTRTALGLAPWRIQVDSPSPLAFQEFTPLSTPLPAALNPRPALPALDNDYLSEQHARALARGWPQGRGPRTHLTVFEAHTLTLTLYYPHRPLLASTRLLLRGLAADSQTPYTQTALRQGFLPIQRRASVMMQTHPVLWPDPPSGKVVRGP